MKRFVFVFFTDKSGNITKQFSLSFALRNKKEKKSKCFLQNNEQTKEKKKAHKETSTGHQVLLMTQHARFRIFLSLRKRPNPGRKASKKPLFQRTFSAASHKTHKQNHTDTQTKERANADLRSLNTKQKKKQQRKHFLQCAT